VELYLYSPVCLYGGVLSTRDNFRKLYQCSSSLFCYLNLIMINRSARKDLLCTRGGNGMDNRIEISKAVCGGVLIHCYDATVVDSGESVG
jgi:hypothetical protein